MQIRHALAFVLALAPLSVAAAPAPRAGQDTPQTPPDNRPEVKALVEELDGYASKRGKQDTEAVGVIDKLLQEFEKCGPKDRALVVKGLDKCFTEKRQESEDGVRDNKLYVAAATALGQMAPECVPVYVKWIGDKAHRRDVALQRVMILKLGKSKAEAGRELLLKLLNDDQNQLIAAAAEALGEYADSDLKSRKASFEALLKVLMSAKSAVDQSSSDTIARDKYDTIAAPIVTTLQRLSKHEEHDAVKWQAWWNKNKKDDWDATK